MYAVRKPKQQPTEQEHHDTTTQAFLREVDEALHEENMQRMWKQWRYPLLVLLLALFASVGGWQAWKEYRNAQEQAAADALFSLLENPADKDILAQLEQSSLPGPLLLTRLHQAQQAYANGNVEEAVGFYEAIAKDESLPRDIRDLGTFYAATAQSQKDPQAAIVKLGELDAENSPYRPSALALQAQLTELQGDRATALALWEKITVIGNVPPALAQQAAAQVADLKASIGQ